MKRSPPPDVTLVDSLHRERQARLRLERQLEDAGALIAALRLQRRGTGDAQQALLERLITVWSDLDHLGDPRRGRSYEAPPGTAAGLDSDEGAGTRRYRAIKAELNRRIRRAIDDAYDRVEGTWEPPPRCGSCGRGQRRSARRCDRCGTPLGQQDPKPSRQAEKPRRAPENTLSDSRRIYPPGSRMPPPRS